MNGRFHKSKTDKKFGGVCAGIAETFDLDIAIVRIAAFFLCLFYPTTLILYLILAVTLPSGYENTEEETNENNLSRLEMSQGIKKTCIQALVIGLIGSFAGGVIYKKVFSFDVALVDVLGFMTLAIGIFLFISGMMETDNNNVKITKVALGSVISFIAITKIIKILNFDSLPMEHLWHSVSYLWPILVICLGITVVVPKKRTAIIIWLIAALIIILYTFARLISVMF